MSKFETSYGSRSIDSFKGKLTGGGARPNLFECAINFPTFVTNDTTRNETIRFMVKAASLPASTLNVIDVPFRGRNLKVAGDRTFDPWTITVINDVDFKIRNAFEEWMNYINRHDDNAGIITPASYQTDMEVYQLSRGVVSTASGTQSLPATSGNMPVLKSYKFYGCFPTSVSAIDLSYESADTIEEFTVDLQVHWWDTFDASNKSVLGIGNTSTSSSTSTPPRA